MSKRKPILPESFYGKVPKELKRVRETYPAFKDIQIELPARILIDGASGSGKTDTLIELIKRIGVFHRYYLYLRNDRQELYDYLKGELQGVADDSGVPLDELLRVKNDLTDVIPPEKLDPEYNNLVVFDDMLTESAKNMKNVVEYFTKSRPYNCTCVWITQNYYSTDKKIRGSADYIILKKLNGERDIRTILQEYGCKGLEDQIIPIYKACVAKSKAYFFLIDTVNSNPDYRFRCNYEPIPERYYEPSTKKKKSKKATIDYDD